MAPGGGLEKQEDRSDRNQAAVRALCFLTRWSGTVCGSAGGLDRPNEIHVRSWDEAQRVLVGRLHPRVPRIDPAMKKRVQRRSRRSKCAEEEPEVESAALGGRQEPSQVRSVTNSCQGGRWLRSAPSEQLLHPRPELLEGGRDDEGPPVSVAAKRHRESMVVRMTKNQMKKVADSENEAEEILEQERNRGAGLGGWPELVAAEVYVERE